MGLLKYGCTDVSRQVFKYKMANGKITTDHKARKMFYAVHKPLADKTSKLCKQLDDNIDGVDLFKKCCNIASLTHEKSCPALRAGLASRTKI